MFTIIGCLGSVVGIATTTEEAVTLVQGQVPISTKNINKMRNTLPNLSTGREYQVEYGGSGCSVRRS